MCKATIYYTFGCGLRPHHITAENNAELKSKVNAMKKELTEKHYKFLGDPVTIYLVKTVYTYASGKTFTEYEKRN